MKTRILKPFLPFMAFVLAIGAAFAFGPAPEATTAVNHFGAKFVNQRCQMTSIECTDEEQTVLCFDGATPLYQFISLTSCPNQLWKIPQ